MDTIKCNRCKVNISKDKFKIKRCGNYQKCCNECNEKSKIYNRSIKKILTCPDCDYKCGQNGSLQTHIKTVHLKEKNYECPECDYKCGRNSNLQLHIKTVHLKEKNYQCNLCDYKCGQNAHLQRHIKTVHLKEQNYECPECDYKCGRNGDLQRHIKTCTGGENISSGESKIRRILTEMKIEWGSGSYELRNHKTNRLLQWDIIVMHNEVPMFIEYDGIQHFEAVKFFGGEDKLEKTKYRDNLKNDYCKTNNYKLLRIPYTQYENIESLIVNFMRENIDWTGS
jgi:hypothetical protein